MQCLLFSLQNKQNTVIKSTDNNNNTRTQPPSRHRPSILVFFENVFNLKQKNIWVGRDCIVKSRLVFLI